MKKKDLIFDDKNFNTGSEAGALLIKKSFDKFGAGRSILIDKNNRIIAGNKSAENFTGENVQIVESDGTKLIAVKRTDIDLDTPEGREMAMADNATAKVNIVWAEDVIIETVGAEVAENWAIDVSHEIPKTEKKQLPGMTKVNIMVSALYEHKEQILSDINNVAQKYNAEVLFSDSSTY